MSPDVAGATLVRPSALTMGQMFVLLPFKMAVGSSAPEIFVNVIDTVFGEEDLGNIF